MPSDRWRTSRGGRSKKGPSPSFVLENYKNKAKVAVYTGEGGGGVGIVEHVKENTRQKGTDGLGVDGAHGQGLGAR